ncbi:hypothetical protein PHYBLDRAFT_145285 [Phycomyces blakesleeanus NRRL 1555(-)]|uniref:AAA+ ATPase domain-containing protein n=1 Tax=Phycomyces blakesleeanus (strain ATCC 8743b / DSM 1359 / FGSC 10004 / NBRC 33097 / NRRL 1555) TaxID=763407 RepID=A0A162XBY4_PHYB8|nr:hypothetical protein PHYBLDRAFT_145285 [Phycomyces blakesleeanus NRRL 1555(-)]OAD73815.1 hypothetical protein PHYBLDRAFT_145285 [Phycomyces blakesleeanus NRRL 1555(-)]|eukprot:XP_018291855.1 hypothetical protein PHYBLDRAFT_145285 [Phycomyces blakesleeanus NRRL 1555(-)]
MMQISSETVNMNELDQQASSKPKRQLKPFFRPSGIRSPYTLPTQEPRSNHNTMVINPRLNTKLLSLSAKRACLEQNAPKTQAVPSGPLKHKPSQSSFFDKRTPQISSSKDNGWHTHADQSSSSTQSSNFSLNNSNNQAIHPAPWPDNTMHGNRCWKEEPKIFNKRTNTTHGNNLILVSAEAQASYFKTIHSSKNLESTHQTRLDDPLFNMCTLNSKQMKRFMDKVYNSHWKSDACINILESIFTTNQEELPKRHATEYMLWTEKYKPTKASLLLSNTRSGNYLKEWLEEMKISPVTMSTERRMNEYYHDIFDDIKEVQVDPDDDFLPTNKTSRQANLKGRKRKRINMSSNMIMLVGDHGVGKTAAVYGTAEETCYDVFEIHPGMKRAGKDLMAAVGDMAENHQVIFDSTIPLIRSEFKCGGEDVSFEETNIPSEYKKRDIKKKSPNKDDPKPKGSIMSYLQKISKKKATDLALSNNQHAPQQAYQDPRETATTITPMDQITRTNMRIDLETMMPPRPLETRQSLILLEEVDNLFEDDKGFWPAVTNLAQKSKRPIIMTCNANRSIWLDIKSVPVNKLSLQAILPFKAPDEKRLLPYLQLVCFSEGYLVYPHDLACLIDVIGCDLRQLIYTLEMWCKTQELPNVQDPGSDKKRFYKLQGLFEHIMGHSNGNNSLNPCLYTLHSTYHMSSISIGYDPKAYKSDSTNICVPCLKDKTKKDCLPVDLKSMQRLLSIGSSLDIWTKFSEKQSFKEGLTLDEV